MPLKMIFGNVRVQNGDFFTNLCYLIIYAPGSLVKKCEDIRSACFIQIIYALVQTYLHTLIGLR